MADNMSKVLCGMCGQAYIIPDENEPGNLPYTLQCGHNFCCLCLHSLELDSVIVCPDCKKDSRLTEDGVEGLEVDSRIVGIIYTAKMNLKKINVKKKSRFRKPRSFSPNPGGKSELELHTDVDLDNALYLADDTLSSLSKIHKAVTEKLNFQIKREKTRVIKDIDQAVERAHMAVQRRRDMLVESVSSTQCLLHSGLDLTELEEKQSALERAVQKAKQVKQFPSLRNYVSMDELLTTLRTPVTIETPFSFSFDSGLSCRFLSEDFDQSLRTCLELIVGPSRIRASTPRQLSPREGVRNRGRFSPDAVQSNKLKQAECKDTVNSNVIIEEIMEEDVPVQPEMNPVKTIQRRPRKMSLRNPLLAHERVFQVWVILTHMINPNHFYIWHVAEGKSRALLFQKIKRLCTEEPRLFGQSDVLETGSLVFVKPKQDTWRRATITELCHRNEEKPVCKCQLSDVSTMQVFYQDHGQHEQFCLMGDEDCDVESVCSSDLILRKMDLSAQAELSSWASQAIKCSLKDIVPADLVLGWAKAAKTEFQRVVANKAVEMQVFGQDGDTLLVDLRKSSMDQYPSEMPVSLREHLVFLEYARFHMKVAPPSKSVSVDVELVQFKSPVYPKPQTELSVTVCHINTPADFHTQQAGHSEFVLMNTKLQKCYSHVTPEHNYLELTCPRQGQACVAPNEENAWCRAHIVELCNPVSAVVRYVDFGYKKILPVSSLCKIREEFIALPAMAIPCCLADVKPADSETWDLKSCESFKLLVEAHKPLLMVAQAAVPSGEVVPVRLFMVSDDGKETCSIAETLIGANLPSSHSSVKGEDQCQSEVWDPPLDMCLGKEGGDSSCADIVLSVSHTHITNSKDVRVRVTHVTSPSLMFVQLLQMDNNFKRICHILQDEYEESEPVCVEWSTHMHCAAKINRVWERVTLCSVPADGVVEVLRCDFGNKVEVDVNNLRPLGANLSGSLVLECSLCNIRPTGGVSTWTATACDFTSYYLTGATAVITVKEGFTFESAVKDPLPVVLYCQNEAGECVSFADVLVSEGLALKERKSQIVSNAVTEPVAEKPCVDECHTRSTVKVKSVPYDPPELPQCGKALVTITAVDEDGVIYAMSKHTEHQYEQLKQKLQDELKGFHLHKQCVWKSGLGCAIMGADMLWYRGEVLEVFGGYLKVRYVDQGMVENIPVCHVYPTVLYEDVPRLCFPCQLHGVTPMGGRWQWDAVSFIKESLYMRSLDVQIMEVPDDPYGCVHIRIMTGDVSFSEIMVLQQYAVLNQEDKERVVQYPSPKLPVPGEHFKVQIKHLRTPNELFLTPLLDDGLESEESLEQALERINKQVEELQPLHDYIKDAPCLAKYNDGKFYRAKLLSCVSVNPLEILIRHVDYGSDDTVSAERLRHIPAELLRFPIKAIKVCVGGFKPPRVCLEQEKLSYRPEWSMKAMMEMIELLHASISASVVSTEPNITVLLYNEEGEFVHLPLVEKGLADEDSKY